MKKIFSLILTLTLLLCALASCAAPTSKIQIGVMSGPTGMGMAKLMSDTTEENELYGFTVYADPTVATADLQSGKLDMLCLPTNTAANLANKKPDTISVISINCLGSLYLLTDKNTEVKSISDLEGKTIYTSVAASTTKPILEYILKENDVEATIVVEKDHDTLVAKLAQSGAPSIAVLPEPKVSAALMTNKNYSVAINLSEAWDEISDTSLTMGCIVVRNEFLSTYKTSVDSFLNDYKASIEYVNNKANKDSAAEMIVSAGVLPKAAIAKNALENLYGSIVYIEGAEMKSALESFYTAIGCTKPADSFYYER